MEYELRRATQADSPAIQALIRRVGINPRDLDWRRFWIAVDAGDRLLGCGQIKPHSDGSFELASIAVQPEAQGIGIGQAVVTKLLEDSPRPLYLMCRARMEPFYLRFGFREALPAEIPPSLQWTGRVFSILKGLLPPRFQGRIMIKLPSGQPER